MEKVFEKVYPQGKFQIYNDKPQHLKLLEVKQIHSNQVIRIQSDRLKTSDIEADGMIIKLEKLENETALAIKTADCLPILYLSQEEIALVHAGWRGLKSEIHLHKNLLAMIW